MTELSPGPDPHTKPPKRLAPPGSYDTHMHIYGPASRYPYIDARDYSPPDALIEDYLEIRGTLGLERTVVIQPSVYGMDHACTREAVERLGETGRGVAVLDNTVTDRELEELHAAGFRGTRFNLVNRGGVDPDLLETMAARIAGLGWHLQVMVVDPLLQELAPRLRRLPVDVVIDHIGRVDGAAGVDHSGFQALMGLVAEGHCWVKLSGAYRIDFGGPPWSAARPFAHALIDAAPDRLVWGTDWPHPDLQGSPMPNDGELFDVLLDWVGDDATLGRILVDNPNTLYDFD